MDVKSEGRRRQAGRDGQENAAGDRAKSQAKRLGGLISCVLGLLLGLGGIVGALLGASDDVSSGVLAMLLGVLGYSLGTRRLGVATIVMGTIALFFVVAASTGLIPSAAPLGHGYNG